MAGLIDSNTGLMYGVGLYFEPGLGSDGLDNPPAFTPASIPGLIFAISPDRNVTTSGGNITAIGGAWGTSNTATASGTIPQAAGLGPNNQNLIQLTGTTNFLTLGSNVAIPTTGTFVAVVATNTSATREVFGSSPATGNLRFNNAASTWGVTTSGGAVVNSSALTAAKPTLNLSIIIATYDQTVGLGTFNSYINNQTNPTTTAINGAGSGFTINRLFTTGAGANSFVGYSGPVLIYNRVLTATERTQLYNFLLSWRGITTYVAQSGSDVSTTFWNPTTPWQTLTPPSSFAWTGDETIYTNSTDVRRYTTGFSNIASTTGLSAAKQITVDGGTWPTGTSKTFWKASTAPTLTQVGVTTVYTAPVASDPGITFTGVATGSTLTVSGYVNGIVQGAPIAIGDTVMTLSGTVLGTITAMSPTGGLTGTGGNGTYTYTGGTVGSQAMFVAPTAGMGPFIYYCPGGFLAFGLNYTLDGASQSTTSNRLYRVSGIQTTPGAGQWGWVSGTLYVNQGVALATGDIELPQSNLSGPFGIAKNNWAYKNTKVAFTTSRGFSNTVSSNISLIGDEVHFGQADGMDNDNALTGLIYQDTLVTWTGLGPVGSGGSAGDGYSPHDTTQADFLRAQGWWNDKGQFDATGGTTLTCNQCLMVGSMPYRLTGAGANGTLLVQNSIAVVSADATGRWPHGITNSNTTSVVTANFNTIYTQVAVAEGNGIYQNGVTTTGGIVAQNNIVNGLFSVGILFQGTGTVTANHNDYFGPSTTYSGVSAGVGDLSSNPLLVSPVTYNFMLQAGSPCIGAGINIPSVTVNYGGQPRSNPPDIGAY